jgi:tRNA A37 methylthiotransferase MiaB
MTALNTDDLAVVTGPNKAGLKYGEVARVIERSFAGDVYVLGLDTKSYGYVRATSLTALADLHEYIEWDGDEEYVRLSGVHDYVYTEDE